MPPAPLPDDAEAMAARYARRAAVAGRYSMLQPDVWQTVQERQRAMLRLFARLGWTDLGQRRLLEIGCGAGGNLLEMLRLGFRPEHLQGVELLPDRLAMARQVLPPAVRLRAGDAAVLVPGSGEWDVVLLATVLSSVLDDGAQQRLADAAWAALRPGGGVLCHDLALHNPRNPDVRAVPPWRLRALFPHATITHVRRITLAPPLARAACRIHPSLYTVLNTLPLLRTHALVWLQKGDAA